MSQILMTRDLMFSSRLASQARQANVELNVVSSLEKLNSFTEATDVEAVFLDLEAEAITPKDVINWVRARQQSQSIVTIAYAPHGQIERLRAARSAGFDQVLTRGQFHQQGGQLMLDAHAAASVLDRTPQEEA